MQPPPGYGYGQQPPRDAAQGGGSQGYGAYAPPAGYGAPAAAAAPRPPPPQQQQQQQYGSCGSPQQLPPSSSAPHMQSLGSPSHEHHQQQQHSAYGMPSAGYGVPAASGGSYSSGAAAAQQQQQQQAFMPMMGGQQQQQYGGGGGGYGAPAYQMPYQPGPQPGAGGGVGGTPGAAAAAGLLSGLSPLGLMTAGGLLSAPQQYVQQRMGWFAASVSGGTMSALFNVTPRYVAQKLLVLCLPFLGRWSYSRAHEQVAGGNKYRPPAADPAAPDLFVPLMAAWTYAFSNACALALRGAFRPDVMGNLVYGTLLAWAAHWAVAWALLRAMGAGGGVPWSELAAYTGYAFVPAAAGVVAQRLSGRAAYYAVWGYGSSCMAVFIVRTMKRVIFEARAYAHDAKLVNYLLLSLAAFQFPWAWWMGVAPRGARA